MLEYIIKYPILKPFPFFFSFLESSVSTDFVSCSFGVIWSKWTSMKKSIATSSKNDVDTTMTSGIMTFFDVGFTTSS